MFKTLILKEIQESILTLRFWLVSVLCLLLIPFGLFIASKDYQSRVKECQNEQNRYIEENQGQISNRTNAEGYFLPSPLCILSSGLKDYLPYKAITSKDGFVQTEKKQQDSNLQSVLFGKIDFIFIVTNFLSLLALIFTFGSISAEKELGTMKLVLSNQVPRWKVILAKIFGNYIVFLAPFFLSLMIGLIVVQLSVGVNFLSGKYFGVLIIIMFLTMLFLLMFFTMGIWASVLSKNTTTSIVLILFVWVFISLGIPRISPMVAQIIRPVKTEDIFQKECQSLRAQLKKEKDKRCRELMEKLIIESHIDYQKGLSLSQAAITTHYTEKVLLIDKEFDQKLVKGLGDLENDYRQKWQQQMNIASNLSRISPVCSYSFLTTELCNTGLLELNNCQETAKKFQYQVNSEIYSNYIETEYHFKGMGYSNTELKKGFDAKNLQVPVMTQYMPVPLNIIFQKTWPDYVLILWYSVFFFIGAFVSFLKFDAR